MTTPRFGSRVSAVAALILSLGLAGCATHSRAGSELTVALDAAQPIVRFDNGGRDVVHVYLVGQTREWLLGRVEPGARATLRIPDAALSDDAGSMRLAVVPGDRITQRAAADPRASITLAQPAATIVSERWKFSQTSVSGELISLRGGRR